MIRRSFLAAVGALCGAPVVKLLPPKSDVMFIGSRQVTWVHAPVPPTEYLATLNRMINDMLRKMDEQADA
jgi:hypothetical protein